MDEFMQALVESFKALGFDARGEGVYFYVNGCRYRATINRHGTIRMYCDRGNRWRSDIMRLRRSGYDLGIAVAFVLENLPVLLANKEWNDSIEAWRECAAKLDEPLKENRAGHGLKVHSEGMELVLTIRSKNYMKIACLVDQAQEFDEN